MWGFVILAVLVYTIYLIIIKPTNYWKKRKLIHSKPWPIVGHMSGFVTRSKSIVTVYKELYNEFPNERYNGIFAFRQPQIIIKDPALIRKIAIKDFDYFTNRTAKSLEKADPLVGRMLIRLNDKKWRDMRASLSPSFTSNKMKFIFQLLSESAENFSEHLYKQSSNIPDFELRNIYTGFAIDAIATIAFGVTVDSLKDNNNEFFMMGKELIKTGFIPTLRDLGYSICPSLMKLLKIPSLPRNVCEFFKEIVKETIAIREKYGVVRPDMIHLLLQSKAEMALKQNNMNLNDDMVSNNFEESGLHKALLTNDDITAQALLFFIAGFETIATLMCFMSYEMCIKPEIQKKLQKEVDEVSKQCDGKITYDALFEMKYMDMVISETLRKWPPAVVLARRCGKDYTIEPQLPHEKVFVVERDTLIVISVVGLHHDPKYFPDPDTFDPERFSDKNKSGIVPGSYVPFGIGPRNCIATRLALMETKVLFFHLLSKLDMIKTDKTSIPLEISKAKPTLVPDGGFWVGIRQRRK